MPIKHSPPRIIDTQTIALVTQQFRRKKIMPKPKAIAADIHIDLYDFTKSNLYYIFEFINICCFKD